MVRQIFKTYGIAFILFLTTFLIAGYFSLIGIDPHHDGILLKPALDVLDGKMLFRDSFSQYNTLTTLIQAAALGIFGRYLVTMKFLTSFIYGCISVLLYTLYKRILPSSLVFITLLLWIFMAPYFLWTFHPWSSVYACLFLLLCGYFVILSYENKNVPAVILAGMCAALTFWTKQSIGLALVFFLFLLYAYAGITRIIQPKIIIRNIFLLCIGIIAVSSFFFIWIIKNNAFNDWWRQTFYFAFIIGSTYGENYSISQIFWHSLFPIYYYPTYIFSNRVWIALPVSSIAVLLFFTLYRIIKKSTADVFTIFVIIFIGFASWMQYYPFIDFRHVYWAATPMAGLFIFMTYTLFHHPWLPWSKITKKASITLSLFIFIIILYPDITFRLKAGIMKIQKQYYTVEEPAVLRGIRLPKNDANYFIFMSKTIASYLDKYPRRNVAILGQDALYNAFDPRIHNIHLLYLNTPILTINFYPDFWPLMNKNLKENKPLVITSQQFMPQGYCVIDNPYTIDNSEISQNSLDNSLLAVPCEDIGKQ